MPDRLAKITARPRSTTAQYAAPIKITNAPADEVTKRAQVELSIEEMQQWIEEDYQLTLVDHADKIFIHSMKYIFLRKSGILRTKSREQWIENYMNAVQTRKPRSTAAAIAEMRKLVYLSYLRRNAERGKTSIFSNQTTTHHA